MVWRTRLLRNLHQFSTNCEIGPILTAYSTDKIIITIIVIICNLFQHSAKKLKSIEKFYLKYKYIVNNSQMSLVTTGGELTYVVMKDR